jgi:predicted metal-dependent hydrolase
MAKYGVERPPLMVRRMEQRWGSCTPSGRALLNPHLILASTACIDYVVVHELCHLQHPHHGRDFYELLGRMMPNWKDRKAKLDQTQGQPPACSPSCLFLFALTGSIHFTICNVKNEVP